MPVPKYCKEPLYYHDRKDNRGKLCELQKGKLTNTTEYKKIAILRNSGREYIANDDVFQQLETSMTRIQYNVVYDTTQKQMTYIYVLSKSIAGQLYFKVGVSEKASLNNRIQSAQTFLIPGLGEDVGFKVHYLYYFENESIGTQTKQTQISFYVEQMCHLVLRNFFKSQSVRFGTDRPSEWYMLLEKDVIYFCGFLMDIIATFAYKSKTSTHKLRPKYIWKLSGKKPVLEKCELPSEDDVIRRLSKDPRYQTRIVQVYEHKGLRNMPSIEETLIEVEDIETDIEYSRGTKDLFERELFRTGDLLYDNEHPDKAIGRKFRLTDQPDTTYKLIDIRKNTFKMSYGQPLKTGEIYGVIQKYITDDDKDVNIDMTLFEKRKMFLIPAKPNENDEFDTYYMEIKDVLEVFKPDTNLMRWKLKSNYDYYTNRERQVVRIGKDGAEINYELPGWYFRRDLQELFAEEMIKNPGKYKHQDYSVSKPSKDKYEWKIRGQIIRKEYIDKDKNKTGKEGEKTSGRSFVFIERERDTPDTIRESLRNTDTIRSVIDSTIREEVPVIRLMRHFKVDYEELNKQKRNKTKIKSLTLSNGDILRENTNIRIAKDIVVQNTDPDRYFSEIITFRITDVYETHVKGDIVFPVENELIPKRTQQLKTIILDDLNKSIDTILPIPKFKPSTIIKAKPSKIHKFGELQTDESKYHYAIIHKAVVEEELYYEVKYFPPWDKVGPWPIPKNNREEIEKGAHSDPNRIHLDQYLVSDIDTYAKEVQDKTDAKFQKYLDTLKTYQVEIAEFLDHKPSTITSGEVFVQQKNSQYLALYDNLTKKWIRFADVPESQNPQYLHKKYWESQQTRKRTKTRRKQPKSGGSQNNNGRKKKRKTKKEK